MRRGSGSYGTAAIGALPPSRQPPASGAVNFPSFFPVPFQNTPKFPISHASSRLSVAAAYYFNSLARTWGRILLLLHWCKSRFMLPALPEHTHTLCYTDINPGVPPNVKEMGPNPDFSFTGINQEGSAELGAAPDPVSARRFPTHLQHSRPAGACGTARPWRDSPCRGPELRGGTCGSAGAALLRAVHPGLEELHGSAPLPLPVLAP